LPSPIEQLFALQNVDTELRALRLELSALGGAASELKTTVGTKRSVTQAKRQEMAELERQRRDYETRLSDEEVRDNAVTFLAAGSETTAVAMMWLFYHLAENPEVKMKLQRELDAVNLDEKNENAMPYFWQCVNESMRITPSAFLSFLRQMPEPRIINGVRFPSGSLANVDFSALHHNKEDWGSTADVFDPERFNNDTTGDRSGVAFVPFGAGARQCIGKWLALEEIGTVMPLLLKRLDFALVPNQELQFITRGPTLTLKDGLALVFSER